MTTAGPERALLAAGDRLEALRRVGLTAAPDPDFDRFAAMVRTTMRVPVALVSLVEPERQVFPGALGLGDPWQTRRETPLSHSFCQHVVQTAEPLVVEDARIDPRVAGNLAITDLNVVGYAGMPLTDEAGVVLGSLCAIDTEPRRWTDDELSLLSDLAAACSDSLRLRIANNHLHDHAERAAAAFDRSQMLLRASVTLANTSTVTDVVDAVHRLMTGTLDPAYVGISLIDGAGRISLRSGLTLPRPVAERWDVYSSSATTPSALAARTDAPVLLPDLAAVRQKAPDSLDTFTEMGWQSAASLPLPGVEGPIGALTLVWKRPYTLDSTEQAVLAALAGYVAQALHRADHLSSRENVAAILQLAMLTDLPDAAPFELAAHYQPAVHGEQVGGDWYDAVRLEEQHLALVVGDVTGHDIRAATRMGRLRNMLRSLLADRNEPPAALLRRLDAADRVLGDHTTATAVLAFLRPDHDRGGHRLQWANAGHLSPLLIDTAGTVELTGRDPMLGVLRRTPRTSHSRHLPPGSTVLFYTDGLIETRAVDLDVRERDLREAAAAHAGTPLPELIDSLRTQFAGDQHEDDIAMLAVRTPPFQM